MEMCSHRNSSSDFPGEDTEALPSACLYLQGVYLPRYSQLDSHSHYEDGKTSQSL